MSAFFNPSALPPDEPLFALKDRTSYPAGAATAALLVAATV